MRKVQTRVLIEVNETRMLRRRRPIRAFCEGCDRDVRMLSPSSAAELLSVNRARIFFLMDTRRIHSQSNDDGKTLICLPSLSLM